jgi:DNA-binding PadR family transcriptional regulator
MINEGEKIIQINITPGDINNPMDKLYCLTDAGNIYIRRSNESWKIIEDEPTEILDIQDKINVLEQLKNETIQAKVTKAEDVAEKIATLQVNKIVAE